MIEKRKLFLWNHYGLSKESKSLSVSLSFLRHGHTLDGFAGRNGEPMVAHWQDEESYNEKLCGQGFRNRTSYE